MDSYLCLNYVSFLFIAFTIWYYIYLYLIIWCVLAMFEYKEHWAAEVVCQVKSQSFPSVLF